METWLILRHLKISFEYSFRQLSLDFLYEAQNAEKILREYQNLIDQSSTGITNLITARCFNIYDRVYMFDINLHALKGSNKPVNLYELYFYLKIYVTELCTETKILFNHGEKTGIKQLPSN